MAVSHHAVRLMRGGTWWGWVQIPPHGRLPRGFVAQSGSEGWEYGWVPIETMPNLAALLDTARVAEPGRQWETGDYRLTDAGRLEEPPL